MNNKKQTNIYHALIVCYIGTFIYAFYHNFQIGDTRSMAMGIVALITPLLMPLFFKLVHFKMTLEIKILNVVFIYFASLVGSCLGGYSIPFFDKVLHFSSGLFGTTLALMLYSRIKLEKKVQNKQDYTILLIFINSVNLSIAALWEFYEYSLLIFFNNDCINHYSTGVHDSLTDMICAFLAGIFITLSVVRYYQSNQKSFFISLYENFYDANFKVKERDE